MTRYAALLSVGCLVLWGACGPGDLKSVASSEGPEAESGSGATAPYGADADAEWGSLAPDAGIGLVAVGQDAGADLETDAETDAEADAQADAEANVKPKPKPEPKPKPKPPATPAVTFTIATQNLWHDLKGLSARNRNMKQRLTGVIPDIVAFQETWQHVGVTSVGETFMERAPHNGCNCRTANYFIMGEGMAITTRFTMLGYHCLELPHSKLFYERWANMAEIVVAKQEVVVINVHLSPDDGKDRMDQLRFVAYGITEQFAGRKVILLGDFNQRYSPEFFDSIEDLGFVHANKGLPEVLTYDGANPYNGTKTSRKIDYIFYRKADFKLKKFGAWGKDLPVSDHTGIWAQFALK